MTEWIDSILLYAENVFIKTTCNKTLKISQLYRQNFANFDSNFHFCSHNAGIGKTLHQFVSHVITDYVMIQILSLKIGS